MDVSVRDRTLRKAIGDHAVMRRKYGSAMTTKLMPRLERLKAAESLADLWPPMLRPERCHELKGDRKGTFSVDLNQPYRLLFRPLVSPGVLEGLTGRPQWEAIRAIEIIAIEDTHG